MTTSICLFHHRKCASNLQEIFNLLREHVIKVKCDLNAIGKKSLCICKLLPNELLIKDEEFHQKRANYEKLKRYQWFDRINRIIELKIRKICNDQISLYKLWKLICEIFNENVLLKITKTAQKNRRIKKLSCNAKLIRQRIELTFTTDQIGHLLGRSGRLHKKIMKDTDTRIHFDNLPYSIYLTTNQTAEFDLDLFQSSSPLKATISGDTLESIDEAIEALQHLEKVTKKKLSRPNKT